MPRCLSIALRLLLVFALVANGIGVSVYAMHAQGSTDAAATSVVAGDEAPCHDMDTTAMGAHGDDDGNAATPSVPHDCCAKTCGCDFVAAAALAPVPWRMPVAPTLVLRPVFDAGALIPAHASLPLRPPIA